MKKLLSLIFVFSLFTVVVSAQTVTKTEQAEIKTAVKKDVNTTKNATYTKKEVKAEAIAKDQIEVKEKKAATKVPSKTVSTSKKAVANPKMTESKTKAASKKKASKIKTTESKVEKKSTNSPK